MATAKVVGDFLKLPNPPLLDAEKRQKLIGLLDSAIAGNKFVTATKILELDTSLLRESSVTYPEATLVWRAAINNMDALIPFALMHGISPDEKLFGGRGLLEAAVLRNDPGLLTHALAFGVNLSTEHAPCFETAVHKLMHAASKESASRSLSICKLLLDAGIVLNAPGNEVTTNTPVVRLCSTKWDTTQIGEASLRGLLQEMLKRGADPNTVVSTTPVLKLAIGAQNLTAIAVLLKAGATTDSSFLGDDFVALLSTNGLSEHVPILTDIYMRTRMEADSKNPTVNVDVHVIHGAAETNSRSRPAHTGPDIL